MASRIAANRKSKGRPVVVGVADHSGWAIFVSVAVVSGRPTVLDRRRVSLIEKALPNQPYEHETRALREDEAEQLLRSVKRSIEVCTALALDRLSADLLPEYRVSGIAIRHAPLDAMPATIGEVHRSYHVLCRADAMMYHAAICAAVRQRGWQLAFHHRGEELTMAAQALQMTPHDVERFVTDLRATLKPPWTVEHRHAFAAAIGRLRLK